MELKEATIRTPTIKDIEDLVSRLDGLVYLQFSESGAMGRPGEVVLGDLTSQEGLVIHHFNYHKWEENDQTFFTLMNKLHPFVSNATASANPFLGAFGRDPAPESKYFRAAFEVGNHLLLSRRCDFQLGENCIYLVANGVQTPLLLTSAPLSIFGPRLFPDSRGNDGR